MISHRVALTAVATFRDPQQVQPCPVCGDTQHQTFVYAYTDNLTRSEIWHCDNPSSSTGSQPGCGSHTHELPDPHPIRTT